MLFKFGSDVITYKNEKLGELESVVVEPSSGEITHLVVRKGFLLTKDKLVPISLVAQSDDSQIKLYDFEGTAEDLQDYQRTMFVPLDNYLEQDPEGKIIPLIFYPPLSSPRSHTTHLTGIPVIEKTLPAEMETIQEGAEVVGMEGKKVGQVQEVVLDPSTDRVTHLLIEAGLLFKHDFLIPAEWIRSIEDSEVDLYVNKQVVKNLPQYQA